LGQVRVNRLCHVFVSFVHFFARPKKRTKKMTPVPLGPSDCLVLLKAAGIFSNSFCSNSEKSLIGTFSCAQQMPMGKRLQTRPFKGQTMPGPSGVDIY
jgi:hypothetical protein